MAARLTFETDDKELDEIDLSDVVSDTPGASISSSAWLPLPLPLPLIARRRCFLRRVEDEDEEDEDDEGVTVMISWSGSIALHRLWMLSANTLRVTRSHTPYKHQGGGGGVTASQCEKIA